MTTRGLVGARLSQLSRCARQCAYGALGVEEDAAPVDMAEYFRRGHWYGRLRHAEYVAAYGQPDVEREREIPWEHGTGHADLYVRSQKRITELVSTVSPSSQHLGLKIDQCKTYVALDPEAESGQVEAFNPSRLVPEEVFPVRVTDSDVEEVRERVAMVTRAVETAGAEMPARVCEHPRDAREFLCPFASVCFAGFVEPEHVSDSEEAVLLAGRAHRLASRRAARRKEYEAEDAAYREVTAELAEHVPAGKTRVGPFLVTRTDVRGRESFRYQVAVKAGAVDPAAVSEFLHLGEPHTRWRVERDDDAALVDVSDLGDEAPF